MRVLQASKAYTPHIGGVETTVQNLAEGIANFDSHESKVLVCNEELKTVSKKIF